MTPLEYERLEDVLPLYVTRRASAQDTNFVEDLLEKELEAQQMLALYQATAQGVHAHLQTACQSALKPHRRAPEQAAASKDHRSTAAPVGTPARPREPSGGENTSFWERWFRPALMGPALALMVVVVMVQSVFLHQRDDDALGAMRGAADAAPTQRAHHGMCSTPERPLLKINMKDETPERELRLMLINTQATIVQGPSQLGDYIVSVETLERTEDALSRLHRSKWINDVRVVKPCP